MKVTTVIVLILADVAFSISVGAAAESERKLHFPAKFLEEFVRPSTADEAAAYIVARMSEDEKQLFLSTAEDALGRFHIGLGTGIRNMFGLWGGNAALRVSMGPMHPESMSAEIIRRVWSRVRADAGSDVAGRVDAIERTLRSISLPNENYQWSDSPLRDKHRLTTVAALVGDLNAAAAEFFSREGSDKFTRVRIEAVGVGAAQVWIRNGRFKPMSRALAPQSFAELLGQLGPPFGRYFILYQDSAVRIFEREAVEEKKTELKIEVHQPPNQPVQPTPGSVTPRATSSTSK